MKIESTTNLPKIALPKQDATLDLAMQLFLGFFILFLVRYQTPGLFLNFSFFLILIAQFVFSKSPQKNTGFWGSICLFLTYKLLVTYFQAANHIFIALYISLAFLIYFLWGKKKEVLQTNMLLILGLTLLFSGFQKIASTDYRSGDYFLYMMQRGDFLWPLKHLSQTYRSITAANLEIINNSRGIYPEYTSFLALSMPMGHAKNVAVYLSYFSIGIELLSGCLILVKPRAFISHALVLTTIFGVFITRQETGFLTLLCVLGLVLSENKYLQFTYAATAVVFLGLILLGVGFL